MPKNIIRRLAATGKMRQAVEGLFQLGEQLDDDYLKDAILHITGQYYGLEQKQRDGIISNEYHDTTLNSIRASFFSLLDDIPDMADDEYQLKALASLQGNSISKPSVAAEPPAGPTPQTDVIRILIFTANTAGETQLDLSDEYARIREMMDNENLNERCQLRRIRLVTPQVILDEILDFKPHVVHFSGHGVNERDQASGGRRRGFGEEVEEDAGGVAEGIESGSDGALIVHNGSNFGSFQIGADFLGGVFEYIKDEDVPTDTVIFNACHSESVAGGVAPFIKYIVATNNEIGDQAAIHFSSTFYQRLVASDASVERAFKAARIVTTAYGEPRNRFLFYQDGKKATK